MYVLYKCVCMFKFWKVGRVVFNLTETKMKLQQFETYNIRGSSYNLNILYFYWVYVNCSKSISIFTYIKFTKNTINYHKYETCIYHQRFWEQPLVSLIKTNMYMLKLNVFINIRLFHFKMSATFSIYFSHFLPFFRYILEL